MNNIIKNQIETLKEKVKQAKEERTPIAIAYYEGQLQAWNDIEDFIEDLKHNQ
jgi:hypothetical protein